MPGQNYTSFIQSSIDPAFERNFARADTIATSRLNSISLAAQRTNQSLLSIGGTKINAGSSGALRSTSIALGDVSSAAVRTTRETTALGNATQRAAVQSGALRQSLVATGAALNVVQGPLGPVAGRLNAVSRALSTLTGVGIGLTAVSAAVFGVARLGSQYQDTTSRLKTVTEGQAAFNKALSDTTGIALRSRSSLDTVVDSYVRLANTGASFGIVGDRLNRIIETASKAATLSGGTAQARSAGLYQFSQALGSGILGGDELRSVKENVPALAKAIADGLDVSIGKLKELGAEGKLTTQIVAAALEASAAKVDAQFAKLPITLSSAAQVFGTRFTSLIGSLDSAVALTSTLGAGLLGISQHFAVIGSIVAGVAISFAAIKAQSVIGGAVNSVGKRIEDLQKQALIERSNGIARRQYAKEAVADTIAQVRATEQVTRALEAEQRALAQNVVELEAQKRAAQTTASQVKANPFNLANPAGTTAAKADADAARITRELAEARTKLNGTTAALAANDRLYGTQVRANTVAMGALATAQGTAVASASKLAIGFRLLRSAIDPVGLVVGLATTALLIFATSSSKAEDAAREFADVQDSVFDKVLKTTGALNAQAASLRSVAIESARQKRTEVEGKADALRESIASRVRSAGLRIAPGADRDRANQIADAIDNGRVVLELFDDIQGLAARNKSAFADVGAGNGLFGRQNSINSITADVKSYVNATQAFVGANRTLKEAETNAGKPKANLLAAANGSVSTQSLRDKAAVDAIEGGTAKLRDAVERRKKLALDNLDKEFGVSKGAVPAAKADAYEARVAAIIKGADAEKAALTASAAARRSAIASGNAAQREATQTARIDDQQAAQAARELADARKQASEQILEENAPALSRQQYLDARIAILKTYDAERNAIHDNSAASDTAAKQIEADTRARNSAITRLQNSDARRLASLSLQAEGRNEEAAVLERVSSLVEQIGDAGYSQYENQVRVYRQELLINDALASRERITNLIQGAADNARQAFTTLLTDLPTLGPKAAGNFFKSILSQANAINAQKITETLFAGTDDKLRALTDSRSAIVATTATLKSGFSNAGTSAGRLATALEETAARINAVPTPGAAPASSAAAASVLSGTSSVAAGEIVVQGRRPASQFGFDSVGTIGLDSLGANLDKIAGRRRSNLPSGSEVVGSVYSTAALNAIKAIPKGITEPIKNFAESIGLPITKATETGFTRAISGAASGAGTGSFINGIDKTLGISKALGLKSSRTGAQIGGAIGGATGVPGLDIAGSIAGSVVGGLFKKSKQGSSTISVDSFGNLNASEATGRGKDAIAAAGTGANSIVDGVNRIAQALGATISGGGNLTFGQKDGDYRVNTSGTSLKVKKGATDFGDDAEAAIAFAIKYQVTNGIISGISQASVNIIKSGQDLQKAIEKATIIESIPKRLLALTDPTRSAITVLNTEFSNMISVLKEGGATTEQFSQAQQLYELERANAIKSATETTSSAYKDLITSLTSTGSSPLNKRTVLNNAQAAFDPLAADVRAGKTVDSNALTAAASNYKDALRNVEGSDTTFFAGFNTILDVLKKADTLAGTAALGTGGDLPASPFASADVQALLGKTSGDQIAAINSQTDILSAGLTAVAGAVYELANNGPMSDDTTNGLLAFMQRNSGAVTR